MQLYGLLTTDQSVILIHPRAVTTGLALLRKPRVCFEHGTKGAFHSTKISGLRFENFLVSNGTRRVRTVSFHSTRKTSFALIEMEDVGSLLLVLELHYNFDGDISDIV